METGSTCARPIQVQLCLRAASQGNFEDVQKQYQQLFQSPEVQTLREQPQPAWLYESLSEAIRLDDVKIVEFLLNEDVSNGEFPVEVAVRKGAYKTLSLFLDYGWDVNKPLSNNEPPILCVPLSTSDTEMVRWLLDHGALPNQRCNLELTPTSYAVREASLDTIRYLFDKRGASVLYGQLLHYAVLRDKPDALEVVRWIVGKGAPINDIISENILGTPLHLAAGTGKLAIVTYLLSMGADPLKVDMSGCTPRSWAEKRSHMEVVDILKEAENR